MQIVLKGETVATVKTLAYFEKIDFTKESHYMKTADIELGFACHTIIRKLKRTDQLVLGQEKDFRLQCKTLSKIQEFTVLNLSLFGCVSCLNPTLKANNPDL